MDSSFAVMDRAGADPVGRGGWAAIKCASKRAYGCGRHSKSAVQYLDLLLYQGDLSSLSVRVGDEAFPWIEHVVSKKGGMRSEKRRFLSSTVEIVDKGIIVVAVSVSEYTGLDYYLVFDSVDRSLSMIPRTQGSTSCYTPCPLPLRHDGGYSLFLFGGQFCCDDKPHGGNKYLWQWSPLVRTRDGKYAPWRTKNLLLPTEIEGCFFSPNVLFSSEDFAFWTDLALGTLCCDYSTLLGEGDPVKFNFFDLPPGYKVDRDDEDTWQVELYRTMGYAGGSVKFVCIDNPDDPLHRRGTRVKVWTLAPSCCEWKLNSGYRLKKLWKDFSKGARLYTKLPMWPMLREKDGDSFYFILVETQKRVRGRKYHICRLDMHTRLLQSKPLAHTSLINQPVILPSSFFEDLELEPLHSMPRPAFMEV